MNDTAMSGRRRLVVASLAIVGLMLLITAWAWVQLPPGASVPIHWDIHGQPNGFAPKEIALLITPVIGLGITALFWVIPVIEPRAEHLRRSARPYAIAWMAIMLLLLGVQMVTTLAILDAGIDVGVWVLGGIGLLFVVLGLGMRHIKSNYLYGIRTPWTLTSERSWERTHRVGGPVFAGFGVALALVGVLQLDATWLVLVFGAGLVMIVGVIVYSYVVWRSDPDRQPGG